jgi:hypothetical protein
MVRRISRSAFVFPQNFPVFKELAQFTRRGAFLAPGFAGFRQVGDCDESASNAGSRLRLGEKIAL